MNILVLRGNPREEGHTQAVTDRVVRGMESEGGSIKDIRLFDKRINRCRGCFKCWYAHKGRCVFRDDMDDLLPALYNADLVFIATPLYHFTMSPSLSDFLNRTLPVTANGFTINGNSNLTNMPTDPERWEGKSLAYLSCCLFTHL
ncbi:MAG: flavodoxin family protein, partial [Chitinivibrionales bacterium]